MGSLPALAPVALDLSGAPPYDRMPFYNAVIQSVSFPADVITFADAIRNVDGMIIVSPWTIPGGLKNALDWALRLDNQPFRDKSVAIQSLTGGLLGGARMQYHFVVKKGWKNRFIDSPFPSLPPRRPRRWIHALGTAILPSDLL